MKADNELSIGLNPRSALRGNPHTLLTPAASVSAF
jgi:hypothetical protein